MITVDLILADPADPAAWPTLVIRDDSCDPRFGTDVLVMAVDDVAWMARVTSRLEARWSVPYEYLDWISRRGDEWGLFHLAELVSIGGVMWWESVQLQMAMARGEAGSMHFGETVMT